MIREPERLLEGDELSPTERLLLESGRAQPAVHFDVVKGAARFRTALDTVASTQSVAANALANLAKIGKLGLVLAPAVSLAAAYYLLQARAPVPPHPPLRPAVGAPPVSAPQAPAFRAAGPPAERPNPQAAVSPSEKVGATGPHTQTPRSRAAAHRPVLGRVSATPTATVTGRPPGSHARSAGASPAASRAAPAATAPRTSVARSEPEADDSIDELRAVARARGLVRRDPEAALRLLDRVARVHPKGYFIEEREALRVVALAAAGHDGQAEQRAETFLRAYPKSPFADQVRAATQR